MKIMAVLLTKKRQFVFNNSIMTLTFGTLSEGFENLKEIFCDLKAAYSPLVAQRLLLRSRQSCNRNSAAIQWHLQYMSFNYSFGTPKTVSRTVDIFIFSDTCCI